MVLLMPAPQTDVYTAHVHVREHIIQHVVRSSVNSLCRYICLSQICFYFYLERESSDVNNEETSASEVVRWKPGRCTQTNERGRGKSCRHTVYMFVYWALVSVSCNTSAAIPFSSSLDIDKCRRKHKSVSSGLSE